MYAKVGDDLQDIELALFLDADFAGCPYTLRSTSGVFMKLMGENTHWPLSALSGKQGAVSHSTTEAELIAAALAMRKEGIPTLIILEFLFKHFRDPKRPIQLVFFEDNQTSMRILSTGRNPVSYTHLRAHET